MEELLLSRLAEFFANPVIEIRVTESDRVAELEKQVEQLRSAYKTIEFRYSAECEDNLRMRDIIRAHGINIKR